MAAAGPPARIHCVRKSEERNRWNLYAPKPLTHKTLVVVQAKMVLKKSLAVRLGSRTQGSARAFQSILKAVKQHLAWTLEPAANRAVVLSFRRAGRLQPEMASPHRIADIMLGLINRLLAFVVRTMLRMTPAFFFAFFCLASLVVEALLCFPKVVSYPRSLQAERTGKDQP